MTDPLDFDGLVIATCQAGQANGFYLSENEARAILSAVLPHVLAGPREALGPFRRAISLLEATDHRDYPDATPISDPLEGATELGIKGEMTYGDFRRAAAELARIDKLTEGL